MNNLKLYYAYILHNNWLILMVISWVALVVTSCTPFYVISLKNYSSSVSNINKVGTT